MTHQEITNGTKGRGEDQEALRERGRAQMEERLTEGGGDKTEKEHRRWMKNRQSI